jgi:hypothetical protein
VNEPRLPRKGCGDSGGDVGVGILTYVTYIPTQKTPRSLESQVTYVVTDDGTIPFQVKWGCGDISEDVVVSIDRVVCIIGT